MGMAALTRRVMWPERRSGCGVLVLDAGLVDVIRGVGPGVAADRAVEGTGPGEAAGRGAGETAAAR